MKKIRLIQVIGIILFVSYIILFVIDLLKGILGNYSQLVLSLIMAIIGLNLLFKGVLIKSNSTLWFANVLITFSLTIIVVSLLNINFSKMYYVFTIIPLFASLLNLIVFNNLIYIKLIILNITIIVPAVIEYFYSFKTYWAVGLYIISILIGILICRLINFDKERV